MALLNSIAQLVAKRSAAAYHKRPRSMGEIRGHLVANRPIKTNEKDYESVILYLEHLREDRIVGKKAVEQLKILRKEEKPEVAKEAPKKADTGKNKGAAPSKTVTVTKGAIVKDKDKKGVDHGKKRAETGKGSKKA